MSELRLTRSTTRYRNPKLYQALCQVFGARNVFVEKVGQKGDFGYEQLRSHYAGQLRVRTRLKKRSEFVGEEFRTTCPFCNDHKPRLYINHLWGTSDPQSGRRVLWLANCFNEGCMSDFENRVQLYELLFGKDGEKVTLDDLVEHQDKPTEYIKPRLPGEMINMEVLARTSPQHPAIQFCLARGYDPVLLGRRYGVGFCALAAKQRSRSAHRLVVPFYIRKDEGSELLGWTARKIVDDTPGAKWEHSASSIAQVAYGIGEASQYRTLVVVEGPGDKWCVGERAVAMLGKTVSDAKCKLFRRVFASRSKAAGALLVLLDPTQDRVSLEKGREHHIPVAVRRLQQYVDHPVLPVYLPEGSDPGSFYSEFLWDYMAWQARRAGVIVHPGLLAG